MSSNIEQDILDTLYVACKDYDHFLAMYGNTNVEDVLVNLLTQDRIMICSANPINPIFALVGKKLNLLERITICVDAIRCELNYIIAKQTARKQNIKFDRETRKIEFGRFITPFIPRG